MVQTPSAPTSADPIELRLARSAVAFLLVLGVPVVAVTYLIAGINGALSAAIGAAVVIGMFLMAGALMSWAARIGPAALMGAVLGGYMLRLFIYAALIILLEPVEWISGPSLAIATAILLVAVLAYEVRVVSRRPSLFWVDAAAGKPVAGAVVYSVAGAKHPGGCEPPGLHSRQPSGEALVAAAREPFSPDTFTPSVERTRP